MNDELVKKLQDATHKFEACLHLNVDSDLLRKSVLRVLMLSNQLYQALRIQGNPNG